MKLKAFFEILIVFGSFIEVNTLILGSKQSSNVKQYYIKASCFIENRKNWRK